MMDNARCQLKKFSKDVIIEAFFSTITFIRADDFIAECERIQCDKKFKSLMAQSEEISNQIINKLENVPRFDTDKYIEWMHTLQQLNSQRDIIQNKIDKILGI